MSNRYQLLGLKDAELLSGLVGLVRRCNELTAEMLAHLIEVDRRMLVAELGFSTLFTYCVEALGMSEGAAGRRCAAARVCRRFPEAFELVARGSLHLSALCGLAKHLAAENAAELFDACTGKSRRQIDELLAARFPRADVKEMVRRLPQQTKGYTVLGTEPSAQDGAQPQGWEPPGAAEQPTDCASTVTPESGENSAASSDKSYAQSGPSSDFALRPTCAPALVPVTTRSGGRAVEPIAADRYKVQFTADAKLRELIERACVLCGQCVPDAALAQVVTRALELFVEREERRRFAIGCKPRRLKVQRAVQGKPQQTPPGGATSVAIAIEPRSRYVPASSRREVYARDGGQCSYVSKDGRRCSARTRLELDHVRPWARMGASDASNLRLRCRVHNILHAKRCFGELHLAAKIAARRSGPRGSTP